MDTETIHKNAYKNKGLKEQRDYVDKLFHDTPAWLQKPYLNCITTQQLMHLILKMD